MVSVAWGGVIVAPASPNVPRCLPQL